MSAGGDTACFAVGNSPYFPQSFTDSKLSGPDHGHDITLWEGFHHNISDTDDLFEIRLTPGRDQYSQVLIPQHSLLHCCGHHGAISIAQNGFTSYLKAAGYSPHLSTTWYSAGGGETLDNYRLHAEVADLDITICYHITAPKQRHDDLLNFAPPLCYHRGLHSHKEACCCADQGLNHLQPEDESPHNQGDLTMIIVESPGNSFRSTKEREKIHYEGKSRLY
ncbi:uncharacterized protein [Hyperolius riggenbachi]|uniref:uncharacterized protein isoform X2 n=1 Tax=Hyperolius riggenbachi TaxID=752182 RepID=UPI0035A323E9